jgi:EmrB/QacA subfamily drug resistance transporter
MNSNARTLRFAALLATYIQAVTTSIPNATLRFIQADLSMTDDMAGWIFDGYLASTGITMPIAQWLAGRFGVKRVYMLAIAMFIFGLMLVGFATTPLEFIGARVIQGMAAGLLAPLSMGISLETLPPERRLKFGPLWTALTLLGITSGPSIGGVICEYVGWRSIFFVSVPIAVFVFVVVSLLLPEKKAEKSPPFDFFGMGVFTVGMIGLQMFIDRGERMDWFDSPEVWVEAIAGGLGLYLFVVHVLTAKVHFLNKSLLKDRNFVFSTIIFFAVGFVLLSTMALTSPMLDEILGYPPITTGALTIPRGAGIVIAFLLMIRLPAHFDSRYFVALGVGLVIYANWSMLSYSPLMYWPPVAIAGAIQGIGLGILMPSISKVAFSTLDPKLRPEGTGFFNLARVYGSTIGVAVVQASFFNNTQAVHLALASHLTPFAIAARAVTVSTPLQAVAGLNDMITDQAAFIAVLDQFKILMMAMVVVSPLILFLRKPASANAVPATLALSK